MIAVTTAFMNVAANRNAIGFEAGGQNGRWYDQTYMPKLILYVAAYNTWANPATSTPVAFDNLKDAEKAFFPLYRDFHATVKASPLVTNGQLEEMGLPRRHSGGRQPHPVDSIFIYLNVIPIGNLAIKVAFENRDTGKSVIPYYLNGALLYYQVSDAPVVDQNELTQSELATHSPYGKVFDPTQRGKYFSVAARWQNRRGETGPWSEIVTVIIP